MGESHCVECEGVIASNEQDGNDSDGDYGFLEDSPAVADGDVEDVDGHEDEEIEPMRSAASPIMPPT